MPTRLAIIGLGGQSRSELIPAILNLHQQAEVVAVCDINPEFVAEALKLLPDSEQIQVYKTYDELLKDIQDKKIALDGVIASVPHFLYGDIVEKFVGVDVQVFKEKPFAHDLAEAKKISNLALRESVQVYTVTKRQFYPSYTEGLRILKAGEIGIPYMYSARHFIPHGNLYQGWRSTIEAAGGGVLMDMGYHLLDVILRYFGDISQANLHWSNMAKPEFTYEVEDAASLHNWHPSGVQGVFQMAALSGPKEESIEIRGTLGRMLVTKDAITTYEVDGTQKQHLTFEADGVAAATKALQQFLLNDRNVWSQNLAHNMKLMRVMDMAYKRRFS